MYSTKEKKDFIKRVCKKTGIHHVSDGYHKFGTGERGYFSMHEKFICKTLDEAFIYTQGLHDAFNLLQKEQEV